MLEFLLIFALLFAVALVVLYAVHKVGFSVVEADVMDAVHSAETRASAEWAKLHSRIDALQKPTTPPGA